MPVPTTGPGGTLDEGMGETDAGAALPDWLGEAEADEVGADVGAAVCVGGTDPPDGDAVPPAVMADAGGFEPAGTDAPGDGRALAGAVAVAPGADAFERN